MSNLLNKRWLLFGWDFQAAEGGVGDCLSSFDTMEIAIENGGNYSSLCVLQVVDKEDMQVKAQRFRKGEWMYKGGVK